MTSAAQRVQTRGHLFICENCGILSLGSAAQHNHLLDDVTNASVWIVPGWSESIFVSCTRKTLRAETLIANLRLMWVCLNWPLMPGITNVTIRRIIPKPLMLAARDVSSNHRFSGSLREIHSCFSCFSSGFGASKFPEEYVQVVGNDFPSN